MGDSLSQKETTETDCIDIHYNEMEQWKTGGTMDTNGYTLQ